MKHNFNIAIINSPIYNLNEGIFLDKHIKVLGKIAKQLFVITGNYCIRYTEPNIEVIRIDTNLRRSKKGSSINRIINSILIQFKLVYHLLKISKRIDFVLFDIGEYRNIPPVLCAKILNKKNVVIHRGGNKSLESRLENQSGVERIIPPIQDCMLKICYSLANFILIESPSIIRFGNLNNYRKKIKVYGGDYIDLNRFKVNHLPSEREKIVGYVGRLSPKKGIMNFIKGISIISEQKDVQFLIIGSGEQQANLLKEATKKGLNYTVTFIPWVSDEDLPVYLNKLKIFVMPSFEEGIPAILREAMASGSIVLSTAVGGIPDIIKEGETGFILNGNDPQIIARKILEVLKSPDLDQIALNARALVDLESSFDASIKNWTLIFKVLSQKDAIY